MKNSSWSCFTTAFALRKFVPPITCKLKHQNFFSFIGHIFPGLPTSSPADILEEQNEALTTNPCSKKPHCSVQSQTPYTSKLPTPVFPLIFRAQLSLWDKNYYERDCAEISLFSRSVLATARTCTLWTVSKKMGPPRAVPAVSRFHQKQQGHFWCHLNISQDCIKLFGQHKTSQAWKCAVAAGSVPLQLGAQGCTLVLKWKILSEQY